MLSKAKQLQKEIQFEYDIKVSVIRLLIWLYRRVDSFDIKHFNPRWLADAYCADVFGFSS